MIDDEEDKLGKKKSTGFRSVGYTPLEEELTAEQNIVQGKYISGRSNTITNLPYSSLGADLIEEVAATAEELTNKTISGLTNTITDLDNTSMTNRTRKVPMMTRADGSGGAVETNNFVPGTAFTGTPTGYVRGSVTVPSDYASGDVTINLVTRSTATANENTLYFVGCFSVGDSTSTVWNVHNSVAGNETFTADTLQVKTINIAAANVAAGDFVGFAWRVSTAITGTIYVEGAYLEYTADM